MVGPLRWIGVMFELENLPLNALRSFEAAGRLGSFRAASQEMGLTQGAVAQHVRGLEEKLETDLFERHPRGVRLTESGGRMHARLQRAFRQMEDAVASLRDDQQPVRLALPGDLALGWMEARRDILALSHPEMHLELQHEASAETDLVLTEMDPPLAMIPVSSRLFMSEIVAVARPGVLVEGRGFGGVHLLHDSRDLWPEFITEVMGLRRPDRLGGKRLGDPETALAAALAGQGVALAQRRAVRGFLADGALEQVDPGVLRHGRAFRVSGTAKTLSRPEVRAVVDWIIAESAQETRRTRQAGAAPA